MQLVVEAARVADGLALRVAAPQRRGGGVAVAARHARPLRAHLQRERRSGQARRRSIQSVFTPFIYNDFMSKIEKFTLKWFIYTNF